MYDRLNDSNNSNDGRNVKHVQERPQKRMIRKIQLRKEQETTGLSETEIQR